MMLTIIAAWVLVQMNAPWWIFVCLGLNALWRLLCCVGDEKKG